MGKNNTKNNPSIPLLILLLHMSRHQKKTKSLNIQLPLHTMQQMQNNGTPCILMPRNTHHPTTTHKNQQKNRQSRTDRKKPNPEPTTTSNKNKSKNTLPTKTTNYYSNYHTTNKTDQLRNHKPALLLQTKQPTEHKSTNLLKSSTLTITYR